MDPDVGTFAAVSIVIVGLVGSLCAIGVVSWKLLTKPKGPSKQLERHTDEQLERLQQSVDAIAIEVERIAEAQRFSAKLLSERPERSSLHS
jgi:CHASE1-domain containing sensor protein